MFFKRYDIVYVFKKNSDGWWEGETKGVYGKFPSSYVRLQKQTVAPKANDITTNYYFSK